MYKDRKRDEMSPKVIRKISKHVFPHWYHSYTKLKIAFLTPVVFKTNDKKIFKLSTNIISVLPYLIKRDILFHSQNGFQSNHGTCE